MDKSHRLNRSWVRSEELALTEEESEIPAMTVLTDPPTYPISAAAARQLDRPLFGHFVDGEAVPAIEGGTMPVIDPATGAQVATAAAGSVADVERAVRSARAAFDDGRWRHLPPLTGGADTWVLLRSETGWDRLTDSGCARWTAGEIEYIADYVAAQPGERLQ